MEGHYGDEPVYSGGTGASLTLLIQGSTFRHRKA